MLADVLSSGVQRGLARAHRFHCESPAGEVPVTVDLRAVTSTHCDHRNTGAGKASRGVLIEELMAPRNRPLFLIIDPQPSTAH